MQPYIKQAKSTQAAKVQKVAGTTKDYTFAPDRAKKIIGAEKCEYPGAQTQYTHVDSGPSTYKGKE